MKRITVSSIIVGLVGAFVCCVVMFAEMVVVDDIMYDAQTKKFDIMLRAERGAEKEEIIVDRTFVTESYIGYSGEFIVCAVRDANEIAFAYDVLSEWPKSGTQYRYLEEADPGLTYILNAGFPWGSPCGERSEMNLYVTQVAIWIYLNDIGKITPLSSDYLFEDKEAYEGMRDAVDELVSKAKEVGDQPLGIGYHKCHVYVNPKNEIDRLLVCDYPDNLDAFIRADEA